MMAQGIQRQSPDDFRFSPDGNVVIAYSSLHAEWEYLDAHTGATLKTVHLLDAGAIGLFFPPHPVASPDGRWLLASTRLLDPPSVWDSKWLDWARGWLPKRPRHHSLTALYDAATGVEMRRLKIEGSSFSHLAPDGQSVLTDTVRADGEASTRRLQTWPAPSQRPWMQIIGIPLMMAAALLGLGWVWRHWRRPALTP